MVVPEIPPRRFAVLLKLQEGLTHQQVAKALHLTPLRIEQIVESAQRSISRHNLNADDVKDLASRWDGQFVYWGVRKPVVWPEKKA